MDRRGDWIQTYTGRVFWPLDPRPEEVCIEDIAHSLALQCRYTGHTREFYCVAQHSILVGALAERFQPGLFLHGLLHDAAEAYLSDIARPIKGCIPEIRDYEERIYEVVCRAFGLDWPPPELVKRADEVLLSTERRDLMSGCGRQWGGLTDPLEQTIIPWSASAAKHEFLRLFSLDEAGFSVALRDHPVSLEVSA